MNKVLKSEEEVELDRDAEKEGGKQAKANGEVEDRRIRRVHEHQDVNHVSGDERDAGEEEEFMRQSAGSKEKTDNTGLLPLFPNQPRVPEKEWREDPKEGPEANGP